MNPIGFVKILLTVQPHTKQFICSFFLADITQDNKNEGEEEVDEAAPTFRRSARIGSLLRVSYKETRTNKSRRTRPFLARKAKKNEMKSGIQGTPTVHGGS
jgi:hypothetical protein